MIVVDCAALIDALTGLPDADQLRDLLSSEELHAPALLDHEVVAAVRGLILGGILSAGRAEDVLADYDRLPIHLWQSADALRRRALQLRDNLTSYDAAYVALAEALGCALITRDARLARSSGHHAQIIVL